MFGVSVGIMAAGGAGGGAGDFESIASVNATGTTVTFSSIPSTYKHLQIRWMATDGGNTPFIRFNGDSSSVYTTHSIDGNGSTVYAQNQINAGLGYINFWGSPSASNTFETGITDIIDYASTTKFKTVRTFSGYDENGSGAVSLTSNLWRSTSAITSLVITMGAGYRSGSVFSLYGIKG